MRAMEERTKNRQKWKSVAIDMAKTSRFKGKPLSLAVALNKRYGLSISWRQVVQVLNDAHLADRENYVMSGTMGFDQYED